MTEQPIKLSETLKKPLLRDKCMFILAKMFGEKVVATDNSIKGDLACTVTAYRYKDKLYVTDLCY